MLTLSKRLLRITEASWCGSTRATAFSLLAMSRVGRSKKKKKDKEAKILLFFGCCWARGRDDRWLFFSCCFRDIPIWNLGNFFSPSLCVSCFLTLPHLLLLQRNRIFGDGAFSGREDEGHLCPFAAFESVSRIQTVRFHICHHEKGKC